MGDSKTLTTAAGIPVPDNQTTLTAGERGPTLLQDHYLLEKLAHFNRECIPERWATRRPRVRSGRSP